MEQDTRQQTEHRDFASPDEVRAFDRGRLELLRVGDSEIGRLVLQPGWRWSEHVKPIAGTELCEAPHFQYHVAGTLRIRTADGAEFDATPGQMTSLPAGHDAWVVGNEEVVVVDWWGASSYAKLPILARRLLEGRKEIRYMRAALCEPSEKVFAIIKFFRDHGAMSASAS